MNRTLPIVMTVLLVALVAAGFSGSGASRTTAAGAEGAAQTFFNAVKARDTEGAYREVASAANVDKGAFIRDVFGSNGSLKTFSVLQTADIKVLNENDNEAKVRAALKWSTAVGAFNESKDLKLVKENGGWKVAWEVPAQQNLPPQVVPVNYLRWDIIRRGADDDWGAQNVEAPKVRIVSMNAIEADGSVIILGEVVNEDTVPGFVNVSAVLVGKDGNPLAEESSFDKVSHTLLPKEVSPFRIDFGTKDKPVKLADVKSVRMNPNSLLVPAAADPVIGVMNQRIEKDERGRSVLRGELVNQSGQTVNIPHVLATFYDNAGKVIWISDGYVDRALQPQTPVPFAVELRDQLAPNVQTYRVTVNHYSIDRI